MTTVSYTVKRIAGKGKTMNFRYEKKFTHEFEADAFIETLKRNPAVVSFVKF